MVQVHTIDDRYLVFSSDGNILNQIKTSRLTLTDVKQLREEYHILGTPTGTLSAFPQQNIFLGLPFELNADEMRLLSPDSHTTSQTWPLFKLMHSLGYYASPGLRFGCHYLFYPGDPARYHSHFLGWGLGWDEPIHLPHLVGGGRLGTGVRKNLVIAAESPTSTTRAFSIEWAGFG